MLAKQLVASKNWRWTVGMVTHGVLSPGVVVACNHEMVTVYERGLLRLKQPSELPDLSHPATVGCVIALARSILKDPDWSPRWLYDGGEKLWVIASPSVSRQTRYSSAMSAAAAVIGGEYDCD